MTMKEHQMTEADLRSATDDDLASLDFAADPNVAAMLPSPEQWRAAQMMVALGARFAGLSADEMQRWVIESSQGRDAISDFAAACEAAELVLGTSRALLELGRARACIVAARVNAMAGGAA